MNKLQFLPEHFEVGSVILVYSSSHNTSEEGSMPTDFLIKRGIFGGILAANCLG